MITSPPAGALLVSASIPTAKKMKSSLAKVLVCMSCSFVNVFHVQRAEIGSMADGEGGFPTDLVLSRFAPVIKRSSARVVA